MAGRNPADNPREQRRMQPPETDDTTDDGTEQTQRGETDLAALDVAYIGTVHYRVLSYRNDRVTAHEVNVAKLTCTCKDMKHNRVETEVCAHLEKALVVHPAQPDIQEQAVGEALRLTDQLRDAVARAKDAAEELDTGLVKLRDAEAGQAAATSGKGGSTAGSTTDGASTPSGPSEGHTPAGDVDDDVLMGQARAWLQSEAGITEGYQLEVRRHAGAQGVAIDPDTDVIPKGQYEGLKSMIKDSDGGTFHVGFGDEPCHACGQSDGEYYLHLSTRVLNEVDD